MLSILVVVPSAEVESIRSAGKGDAMVLPFVCADKIRAVPADLMIAELSDDLVVRGFEKVEQLGQVGLAGQLGRVV
jgi:hypothetical protein